MIRRTLRESEIPSGFEIDFKIHKNALTFNMIDEQDIRDIVEILKRLISRMEGDLHVGSKEKSSETFYFPFDARGSVNEILVTVKIKYNTKSKWDIRSVNVMRQF